MSDTISVMNHVIKRRGHQEPYDQKKLYASVYAACMEVGISVSESELIADRICRDVQTNLGHKPIVAAHEIREITYHNMRSYNPNAAYIYHKNGEATNR